MASGRVRAHVRRLHALGLHVVSCWGGGKALRGRDHRALADSPPDVDAILGADYAGGLAVLCGTERSAGGHVVGVDVDRGPESWPAWPRGTLYAEAGTEPGRWHVYIAVLGLLDGQRNVYDQAGHLVVEIKGRGHALRSWPTLPAGKARGYRPMFLAEPPGPAPELAVRELTEGLSDYLGSVLGELLRLDAPLRPRSGITGAASPGLVQGVQAELERRGVVLRPAGRDGWQQGRCPLHDDNSPSFSVNFALGVWKCWSGCGSGGLRALAERLGLTVYRWRRGHPILPEVWA